MVRVKLNISSEKSYEARERDRTCNTSCNTLRGFFTSSSFDALFGRLSSKSTSELVHSADVVPDILGGCPSTKYYQFLPYYFACYT